jgi:hypothetical protein
MLFEKINKIINSPSFMGIVAQASASSVSFIFNLFLIATFIPIDFATYSISITVVYFISGLGSAIWSTQVAIFDRSADESIRKQHFKKYQPDCLISLLALVVFILLFSNDVLNKETGVVLSISICAYSFFIKEYLIRYTFNAQSIKTTASAQTIYASSALILLLIAKKIGLSINIPLIFIILTVSNYFGFFYIYHNQKFYKVIPSCKSSSIFFNASLHGAFAHTLSSIRSYGYNYIAPFVIGLNGLAEINAARVVTSVSSITTPPLTQMHQSRIIRNEGIDSIKKSRKMILIVTIATVTPIIISYPFLSNTLFKQYDNLFTFVILWGIQALFASYRATLEVEIVALHLFKLQSIANLIALFATFVLVASLGWLFGAQGAMLALIASEIMTISCIIALSKRK